PTIGRPIDGSLVYIVDARLEPTPAGVPGELCIGGESVGRGYLGRPALTAEKFVPDPFSAAPGARLYRTGDVARFLPDGEIEFVGRVDHQVKLRGYRIELGEIEGALLGHEGVREAVVLAREDVPGRKRLVAYVSAREGAKPPGAAELAAHLKASLPEYMVPSAIVTLPALPMTHNGKVDRRALPAPDALPDAAEHAAPRDELEGRLCRIVAEALGLPRVGVHDRFFEAGASSLDLTKIRRRAEQELGVSLPLATFFEHPSVAELAEVVRSHDPGRFGGAGAAAREGEGAATPATPAMPGSVATPGASATVATSRTVVTSGMPGTPATSATSGASAASEASAPGAMPIAIIGLAGRFPGAANVAEFWDNVRLGRDCITRFEPGAANASPLVPEGAGHPRFVGAEGLLEAVGVDPELWRPSAEGRGLDLQSKLFVDAVLAAFEDAGHDPWAYPGRVALYGGASSVPFVEALVGQSLARRASALWAQMTFAPDTLPMRAAHTFGFRGEAVSVNTACSTGLSVVHLACQSLLLGQSDAAVAVAANVPSRRGTGYVYEEGMILSRDGRVRPFDANACGVVVGQGVGAVLLKPLAAALRDGDRVYAVIRATAT
ncbi:MAG TPA: beta-ketoacyl synthase N-terminal-like domain-containing protein, partial [Polyangiaceae bacterium]|nr:beta-ketoacyl synthase N-terminal-like domain-containing protein [Polyangiaceae bacterium]